MRVPAMGAIKNMIKSGIDGLGFSNVSDPTRQIQAIQFCGQHSIPLNQTEDFLLQGEIDDEQIEQDSQVENESDSEEDENFNEKSVTEVAREALHRIQTRSFRRNHVRSLIQKDSESASQLQHSELSQLDCDDM